MRYSYIRTPMNALLGYNQLMKKELTDPKLLHYQRAVEQSGNLLLVIINNVLDMARIESGRVELDESYARIDQTVDEIKSVFEPQADQKGLNLIFETQVEHQHVLCDITKTKQIQVNLISNAVKYTPAGGTVTVTVQEIPCEQENSVKIQIEVRDTGIGMSKEFLPTLFDSFSRERNTTVGKVAGTGLGMAIVKKYVDLMGGSIDVKSELGKGTVFTLILIQKKADENYYGQKASKTDAADMESSLRGKHILLAEDNELNAEIAIAILEETGLIIDRVEDGIQCVDRIEQMPAGTYDMILMDIQMPNMDGYEATKCIRHLQDIKKAEIPIIAMTANAFQEDAEKCIAVGMNAHLAKPLDIKKVEQTICKQVRDAKMKNRI
ncbi:response regulator [Ruminococcus sp. AM28-41]|jgi:CheY-like chemotaxis protein|nr:response regulator [Ruminococcus sp. AM28-41]